MFRPDYSLQHATAAEDARRERRLEHIRGLRLNVVSETDLEWDRARRAWNLAANQRPPHVAFPETTDDVLKLVTFAGGTNYNDRSGNIAVVIATAHTAIDYPQLVQDANLIVDLRNAIGRHGITNPKVWKL